MLTVHSTERSTYSLHMQGGLRNPFISGEKKKAIHSQQIPFCHGNPPSRPSSTTVVHRGCLKQDNKTKPSPIQPWHFLLRLFWAGITPGWGREGVNCSFCPLTCLGASHLCPSMGGVSGTPRAVQWDSGSDHVMEAGNDEGNLFHTLLCQGESFGLPEPRQRLEKGKTGPLPALSPSVRISPASCSPFHGEHIHGSNSSWAPARSFPVWRPPAILG